MSLRWRAPRVKGGGEGGVVLADVLDLALRFERPLDLRPRNFATARNRSKVLFDQFFSGGDIDIAADREGRIAGQVMRFIKLAELFDLRLVDILKRADRDP